MSGTRQAIMLVHHTLLESMMSDWMSAARTRYMELLCLEMSDEEKLKHVIEPYHRALKLPPNSSITCVSVGYKIDLGIIAIRIECSDFVETPYGYPIPEVEAVYQRNKHNIDLDTSDNFYFLCWKGSAVETHKTYGPDGKVEVEQGPPIPIHVPTLNGLHVVKTNIRHSWTVPVVMWTTGKCWVCRKETPRTTSDGTWECLHCSTKPLL